MEISIKRHLLIIVKVLTKIYRLIDIKECQNFIENIDNYTFDELSNYLCKFFSIAVMNPKTMFFLKNEFYRLYHSFSLLFTNISKNKYESFVSVKNTLTIYNYYELYLDYYFGRETLKNTGYNELEVLCNRSNKIELLTNLYGLGANIYEADESIECDALIVFDDQLTLKVYFFEKDKEGNIIFNKTYINSKTRKYILNKKVLELGYDYHNLINTENAEFKFISLVLSGTVLDYIKAYELSKHINIKKLKELNKELEYNDIEVEENYGLQKTSRLTLSKC